MTNIKTEIEEIEKRFDEKFRYHVRHDPDLGEIKTDSLYAQITAYDDIKAFFKAELPSLLSKFAAEINGEEQKIDKDLFLATPNSWYDKTGWNHHHRSVAEKAEEIIKEIQKKP
jgi:hypothetical protein